MHGGSGGRWQVAGGRHVADRTPPLLFTNYGGDNSRLLFRHGAIVPVRASPQKGPLC
eukprot:COSAG01_NODE_52414_length_346_cov_24.906883_1_plen_56_part_01